MNSEEYHNARCGLPDKTDEPLACPVERGVRSLFSPEELNAKIKIAAKADHISLCINYDGRISTVYLNNKLMGKAWGMIEGF